MSPLPGAARFLVFKVQTLDRIKSAVFLKSRVWFQSKTAKAAQDEGCLIRTILSNAIPGGGGVLGVLFRAGREVEREKKSSVHGKPGLLLDRIWTCHAGKEFGKTTNRVQTSGMDKWKKLHVSLLEGWRGEKICFHACKHQTQPQILDRTRSAKNTFSKTHTH